MNIKKYLLLAGCLFYLLTGCSKAENEDIPKPNSTEPEIHTETPKETPDSSEQEEPTEELPQENLVEFSHEETYMSLSLPQDWDFSFKEKSSQEEGMPNFNPNFGIYFWPREAPGLKLYLYRQQEISGLCGTGVNSQKCFFDSGLAGTSHTEELEDGTFWYLLIYDGHYGLTTTTTKDLWTTYQEELDHILETIKLDPLPKGVSMAVREQSLTDSSAVLDVTNSLDYSVIFGDYFRIERLENKTWKELSYIIDDNIAFHDIGYEVTPGSSREFSIDWEWIYGKLQPGEYRIIKTYVIEGNPGSELNTVLAEFIIK